MPSYTQRRLFSFNSLSECAKHSCKDINFKESFIYWLKWICTELLLLSFSWLPLSHETELWIYLTCLFVTGSLENNLQVNIPFRDCIFNYGLLSTSAPGSNQHMGKMQSYSYCKAIAIVSNWQVLGLLVQQPLFFSLLVLIGYLLGLWSSECLKHHLYNYGNSHRALWLIRTQGKMRVQLGSSYSFSNFSAFFSFMSPWPDCYPAAYLRAVFLSPCLAAQGPCSLSYFLWKGFRTGHP